MIYEEKNSALTDNKTNEQTERRTDKEIARKSLFKHINNLLIQEGDF